MFDFSWSEIALIGVVALILIGPKDLPIAIKAVSEMVKKARRMAGEFQTHVDEMVRDADLKEVRETISDIRRMDIKGKILDAVDGDRTIRNTINDNPFDVTHTPPPVPPVLGDAAVAAVAVPGDAVITPPPGPVAAPPFIPPTLAVAGSSKPAAPAFLPPQVVAQAEAARAPLPY